MQSLTAREPLIVRAALVAVVTAALHTAVVLGWLPIAPEGEASLAGFIDLAGTAVLVVWSRGAVTPTADPRVTPRAEPGP